MVEYNKHFLVLLVMLLICAAAAADNLLVPEPIDYQTNPDTLVSDKEMVLYHWSVNFVNNEDYINGSFDDFFDVEIFIDNELIDQITTNPEQINEVIKYYKGNHNIEDQLHVLMLNSSFKTFSVQNNKGTYFYSTEEIVFTFYPGQETQYQVTPIDPSRELTDYYFIYIENSGGIKNLGTFRNKLDSLAHTGDPFLVYYNGPAQAVVVNDTTDIARLYNILFTSITQPPHAHEELRNVRSVLNEHIGADRGNISLHIFFVMSEISYYHLHRRFVVPLLEENFSENTLGSRQVHIYTDFDITDKHKNFQYINISTN